MANLITEIYLNGITKGIDEKHSFLKNLFSEFSNVDSENLNKIIQIKNDLFFENKYNDLLTKLNNKKQVIKLLNKYGYEQINKKNYPFAEKNFAGGEKIFNGIFNEINFVDKIKIKNEEFSYFVEKDCLILYNENNNSRYFFNLENIKIRDLKIDKYNFIYILYNYKNKQYITKTHFAKVFSKYNEQKSGFNIKETFYTILLEDDKDKFYSEIININFNNIYLIRDKIYSKELYSKYYFIDEENIYFNHQGELENYKSYFLETIQVEFNNIYNYLNFLGLNDFKIKNRKISTYETETFKDLFANKFDNTFNGSTNYFLVKNHYENPEVFKLKPDYHFNYKDDFFAINGNFCYKMQKGNFKIIIKENNISLYKKQSKSYLFLESITLDKEIQEFYFYQLRFQLIDYEMPKYYELKFEIKDNYIFKQQLINKNFDSLHIDKENINYFLSKENINKLFSRSFKNNSIIFWNLFDWKKNKYIYNSIKETLKANYVFDLTNIKDYKIIGSFIEKNNKIYTRSECIIYYTLIDNYSFELINKNGYISEFWKNNQNKNIYFIKDNNQLNITNNFNSADFKIKIPEIKKYININNSINNIDVLMNDVLEYELDNKDNLLATIKFKDKPLFWKVYIDSLSYSIYNSDDEYISNTFEEDYNDGKIVYFNKENNKKYYYIKDETQEKIYFEPIKAFQNIKVYYNINKLGETFFNKHISLLSLNSINKINDNNFQCKLYIYNKKNVKTVSLNKNSLNKPFEYNDFIEKIKLEVENPEDFYLTEESNTSIEFNNKIIYFKKDYDDICYLSKETPFVQYDNVTNNIQLNKKYYYINNQLVEDKNGNIFLENLNGNYLFIEELNKDIEFNKKIMKTFSASGPDEFYLNNFKSIGIEHEFLDITDSQKIKTFIEEIEF